MHLSWRTQLFILTTLQIVNFIEASLVDCPQGDYISFEPVLSHDSSPISIPQSSIQHPDVSSSTDCLEVCKNVSCLYAYHQASTGTCYVQPEVVDERVLEAYCAEDHLPVTNISCDATDQCVKIVRRCRKCGHQPLSAVLKELHCKIEVSNSAAEFCKHSEKVPIGCPFGHKLEYIDYYTDLRQTQATLASHFARLDEDLSRSDCFERCKAASACSSAFYHQSSGMCFLARVTAGVADKLCSPAMQSVVTQVSCNHDSECAAMMKVCESCGAAMTVDTLYMDAGCGSLSNLTDWCFLRSRFVCQINPTARFCPAWIKKTFFRRAGSDAIPLYGKPNSVQSTNNGPEFSIGGLNKLKSERVPDPEPLYHSRSGGILNQNDKQLNLR